MIALLFFSLQTLLDRFDYDDEPEGADEIKKEEMPSAQPVLYVLTYFTPLPTSAASWLHDNL